MKDFELISHTADLKILVFGTTLEELFIHALQGMFQSCQPKAPSCITKDDRIVCKKLDKKHPINLESNDLESLLVDFLSQALSFSDIYNEAYLDARITISDSFTLTGTIFGISITGFEIFEIKAVTYHDLAILKTNDGWQAQIVFDI